MNIENLPKRVMIEEVGYLDWYNLPIGIVDGEVYSWNVKKDSSSILVSGGAGTGKTTIIGNLIQYANENADRWSVVLLNPSTYDPRKPIVEGLKDEKYYSDFYQCSDMIQTINTHMNKRLSQVKEESADNYFSIKPKSHGILLAIDSADELLIVNEDDTDEIKEIKNRNSMHLWNISRVGRTAGVYAAIMSSRPKDLADSAYGGLVEGIHIDFTRPEEFTAEDWPAGRATINHFFKTDVIQTFSQNFHQHQEEFD